MTPTVTRQPHPGARRRLLTVARLDDLTPHLRRVTLTGDLDGFRSAGADDHVKVFFPAPGQTHAALLAGEAGARMRDYTPRRHDPEAGELALDFVLHGGGVGSTWAARARPGDPLVIGGPRGSLIVSGDFAAYLLVGDESALPAIARRLEELPAGALAQVIVEVGGPEDELPLPTRADAQVTWLHRGGAQPGGSGRLGAAVRALTLPPGDVFAWAGCEYHVAARLRAHLQDERGLNPDWVRVSGYWRRDTGEGDAALAPA